MAHWHKHVQAAEHFFQSIETALSENCINFHEVYLYPWQSGGGRSNGVTAEFYIRGQLNVYVTIYQHWNSDQICLQFNKYLPCHMHDKHDDPHVMYDESKWHHAILVVQLFLIKYFNCDLPKELYINGTFNDAMIADQDAVDAAYSDMLNQIVNFMGHCEKCDSLVHTDKLNDSSICKQCSA